jgi:hypothetical protein
MGGDFPLGVGDTWTIGFWVKPLANNEFGTIWSTGLKDKNEIQISTTAVPAETSEVGKRPAELRVIVKDASGTTLRNYGWPNHFHTDTWVHTAVTWDGTDLSAFKDGVPVSTGVGLINVTGTLSDYPNRRIFYGSAIEKDAGTFSGTLGHFGLWNSELAVSELGTIVSGGFSANLTTNSGSYISSGNLQHYWKPGDTPGNIGEDFSTVGNQIDLNKLRAVTTDNITPESP